jgi:choline kinase
MASLWFARDFLTEDTLILNGDVYMEDCLFDILINNPHDMVCLSDMRLSNKRDDDYYQIGKNDILLKKERNMDVSIRNGMEVGNYKISKNAIKDFRKRLDDMVRTCQHDLWAQNVLYSFVNEKRVYTQDVGGKFWAEIDYMDDYNKLLSKGGKK